MFKSNTNVVINSEIKTFVFKLENGEIKYDIFDLSLNLLSSSNLPDKGIKIYSVFIDLEDIIHLVALINTGELNYYKYIDEKWLKGTIANFDLKSNIYNQIKIFTMKNQLHLIYNYSNLINSNIWTLQHVIYDKTSGEKYNIIRYLSKRTPNAFFVDVDNSGAIHLLYNTDLSSISQVQHIFYSPYTSNWVSVPKQISSDNINNLHPYLFIDLSNNLHALLLEELIDGYKVKYLRMSSSGRDKYIWKEINLPYISISNFPPIIFQEDNKLKLLYRSNNKIKYLISTNYGTTWSMESTVVNVEDDIFLVNITSNLSSQNHKINHIYLNNIGSPKLNFLDIYPKTLHLFEEIKPDIIVEETVEETATKLIQETITIDADILNEINYKIDQLLHNYKAAESFISMIVSNQLNTENILNNIQDSLDENKQSFFARLFNQPK